MALLLGLCAALLVGLGGYGLRLVRSEAVEGLPAVAGSGSDDDVKVSGLTSFVDTVGARFQRLLMTVYGPRRLRGLETRLRRAGRPEKLTVSTFMQRQAGFTVLGLVCAVFFTLLGQAFLGVLIALLFAFWMEVWLRAVAATRRADISRDLPDFLDVLGVTVSAGLSFQQAIERVGAFHDGPLGEEMSVAIHEMAMGVSRRDAFIGIRDRTQSESVGTFVTALLQAAELGVPIADALRDISSEVRRKRAQEVRQAAAKAAPKVSLVVTMTIVPGALILMMSGMLISNMEMFSNVFG